VDEGIERFRVVTAGAVCGSVEATTAAGRLDIVSRIEAFGRSAELREMLRLDANQAPTEWQVSGTSTLNGPVSEYFNRSGGSFSWRSSAGDDSVLTQEAHLYLPADSSGLAVWIYARAAIAAGGAIRALPSGTVRARLFRQTKVDLGDGLRELRIFAVTGAALTPRYVLLDAEDRLVAVLGDRRASAAAGDMRPSAPSSGGLDFSELLIREDVAEQADTFTDLLEELTTDHLRQIQNRTAHRYDRPVRFANVRVFDPTSQQLGPLASVTVFGDRITTVQDQAGVVPELDEVVVEGAGGTLLAGLHDLHNHVESWCSLLCIATGVTTVRDMGNNNAQLLELAREFNTGSIVGPTVIRSGFIEGESEYSLRLGVIPRSLDEALEAVRWYGARGYRQIKIYNSVNPDWVSALTVEAHRLGMRAVGHVPAFTTADRMIEAGYDEITHVNQLMLGWLIDEGEDTRHLLHLTALSRAKDLDLGSPRVRHTIELMRTRGIGLDTTAVILERHLLSRDGTTLAADAPYLDHMPVSFQRLLRRTTLPHTTPEELDDYKQGFTRLMELIRLLHDEGIPLWPGTDDSTGFTVHRELELYVAAGIPAPEVLRIATQDCATHVGLGDSHGSIERGKVASFVLLDGDPTADISAVRQVRAVAKDGTLYFPSEIYSELNIEPFCAPPRVTAPAR